MLIAGFVIASLIRQDFEFTIYGYFIVGGWQVISMLVHAIMGWFTAGWGTRTIYNWITLVSVMTMPLGSFWILLFTAPFMAIFYTWLCWHEVHVKMRRPLALLK